VCSLTRSCPATMLYGELEIVHSGGRVETPNVRALATRYGERHVETH
jgi:hypothetical protein